MPPVTGVRPSHYVIEGGVSSGQVAATIPSPTAATIFTFRAPVGAFYLRVRAVFGDTMSAPSNELPLLVGVPTPPSAPKGLLGLADGSTVRLAWENTFNSGTPSGIVLEISGTHTVSIPLALTDRFEFPSVPNGTYRVAVRAMNTFGSSAPSNAVTLTFPGGCTPPHMPSHFLAFRSGRTIGMSWGLPNDGTAPDRYLVSVSGSGSGSFETAGLMLQADVPSGTYALSVAAMNACGTSANTPTQIVVVP